MPPKKRIPLGKSLIKSRFRGRKRSELESERHTSELGDGFDWNKINLLSVTEETSIDEFLTTAQLAGTEFAAEKLNVAVVKAGGQTGVLGFEEQRRIDALHEEHRSLLRVPRRPMWTEYSGREELHAAEEAAFLRWRRDLSLLQEHDGVVLTPYERNLDFWRQLWRVVERSDLLVQIVDARNPLLYRCDDLDSYSRELDSKKQTLLLLNKSDLLTDNQRLQWSNYFNRHGIRAAFFSALQDDVQPLEDVIEEAAQPEEDDQESVDSDSGESVGNRAESSDKISAPEREAAEECSDTGSMDSGDDVTSLSAADGAGVTSDQPTVDSLPSDTQKQVLQHTAPAVESSTTDDDDQLCSPVLLTRQQLLRLLKRLGGGQLVNGDDDIIDRPQQRRGDHGAITVGFVGYPNVGKSSTINCLVQAKRTSVSATPGKTKHFQTLYIDADLMLCDCPGLVMPSFVSTKADLVVWGVLPIDQMRDHVAPVGYVAHVIPRHVLERTYGLILPQPREGESQDRPPTAGEVLDAHGYMRGFMTQRGLPDNPRSARVLLKDFVSGKLLYCVAPPGVEQLQFHSWPLEAPPSVRAPPQLRFVKPLRVSAESLNCSFFSQSDCRSHSVDIHRVQRIDGTSSESGDVKPWRTKGYSKRPKRVKLRCAYRHLDVQ